METTGMHMMRMAGMGSYYGSSKAVILLAVLGKVALCFLFVWLSVWLLHHFKLPPFDKK